MKERITSLSSMKEEQEEKKITEQMESKAEETKPVRYKRADIVEGYLEDPFEIESFKTSQGYDAIFNFMLGEYDDIGEYSINKDILQALVMCHKHITRAYADTIYLQSYFKFEEKGYIEFSLSFAKNSEGKTVAILKVMEPVSKMGGYLIDTHAFVVATYTDVNDENYMTKVKKAFHIYDSEEEGGKDDLKELDAIIKRLQLLKLMKEALMKDLADREEKYFNARLEALKDVKFEDIMKEFERLKDKTKVFIDPKSPMFFFYMNQILDTALYNIKFANMEKYLEAIKVFAKDVAVREFMNKRSEQLKEAKQINIQGEELKKTASKWQEPKAALGADWGMYGKAIKGGGKASTDYGKYAQGGGASIFKSNTEASTESNIQKEASTRREAQAHNVNNSAHEKEDIEVKRPALDESRLNRG